MNILNRTLAALVAAFVLVTAAPLSAQTVLSTTTLSAAVADGVTRVINVTSATGITAPGNGSGILQTVLLIDKETFTVTAVTGTAISVSRGPDTRAVPHLSGATVWIAPRQNVYTAIPSGQCVRTNLQAVPYIVGGAPGLNTEVGALFDCMGLTTAGQWVQTNGSNVGYPILGATIASPAGLLTPSGTLFKVSGTSAITGFVNPAGIAAGFTIAIEPTGVFTWTTANNIILAGSAVVGKILYFMWDGAKWVPSYIA